MSMLPLQYVLMFLSLAAVKKTQPGNQNWNFHEKQNKKTARKGEKKQNQLKVGPSTQK